MKIGEIINHLESRGSWVDFDHTRDLLYCGETGREVDKVGVCWVATRKLLQKAAEEGIHFIISHENFLYVESTSPYKGIRESRKWKLDFCKEAILPSTAAMTSGTALNSTAFLIPSPP